MEKKYKLAIVGATGLVGRTALKVLEERNLPNFEYKLFCSKKSAGTKINFMGKEYLANELTETSFDEGFDFAIFSAGGETSKKFAPIAASKGCIVIDNSSYWRMHEDVPLVVPEVNPKEIQKNTGIIANPNCSTIQAVVPLKPLHDRYKIKRIVYSTYQAVSGAGKNGLEDLLSNASYQDLKKFPHPIHNNCLPHIDVFMEDGYTKEEHKMIDETRKILGDSSIRITATTVRVPVENCHGESINVEFENDFDLEEVKSILKNSEGIILYDDPENNIYPLASVANGRDEVFVGRLRRDYSQANTLNFWCVADNIRKGAATNAIQIMEKII
jgi:aspartate-semialdehyde dehydrogenase